MPDHSPTLLSLVKDALALTPSAWTGETVGARLDRREIDAMAENVLNAIPNPPPIEDFPQRVSELLVDDPTCDGRVSSATINAIAALAEPMASIAFHEAETVGQRLYDYWAKMGFVPPFPREDMVWGDIVQRVAFEARAVVRERGK